MADNQPATPEQVDSSTHKSSSQAGIQSIKGGLASQPLTGKK